MASKRLVGYDSGEDSDSTENFSQRRGQREQPETTDRAKDIRDKLTAEWESFEKLIETSNEEQTRTAASEQDRVRMLSSDRLNKPGTATGGHAANQPLASTSEVRQKWSFQEVQSNSDGNSSSDSEDESRPVLPALGGNSGSNNKTDRHSTSSDSSRSVENKLRAKSASSDGDTSSDDEKHTGQTKLPLPLSYMKSSQQKSSSSDSDTSSDSDSNDKRQNAKSQVSDANPAGQRPVSAHTDSSGTAGNKQGREEKVGKEKSPSHQTLAQERIRAKLIAISEQSAATVKKSLPAQSRDIKTSTRAQPPSPKRRTHSRDHRSFQRSRPARRSRSRSGRRHRHSRDDRSRSRSAGRGYKHHRDHGRRHSRDRHTHRHRSRDRHHSRSRSPSKPKTFKEQLKAQLFSTAQPLTPAAATVTSSSSGLPASTSMTASTSTASAVVLEARKLLSANEKPSNLPLFASNPLASLAAAQQGMAQKVTPQQALAQTMAAMHQKAQQMTGVAVPSYYNPAAVNPLKYAEQLKKRKMLWSKAGKDTADKEKEADSKTVQSVAQWTGTSFAADEDGKVAAKFRKLMGIREEDKALLDDNVDLSKLTEEQRRRQEELFAQLDKEYAFARMTTHSCRGVGLGFQSQGLPDT